MPWDLEKPIKESDSPLFDEGKWRDAIKARRKELNIPNAAKFVETLWLKTRVKMHENTYYKIEQGGQKPSLLQFFSINIVLFDDIVPPKKILSGILSREWVEVINRCNYAKKVGYVNVVVPEDWGYNNFHSLNEEVEIPKEFQGCEGFERKFLISKVKGIDHRLLHYPGEQEDPYPDTINCVYEDLPIYQEEDPD